MINTSPGRKVCRILMFSALIVLCSCYTTWAQYGSYERLTQVEKDNSSYTDSDPIFLPANNNVYTIVTNSPNHGTYTTTHSQQSNTTEFLASYKPDPGFVGLDTMEVEVRLGFPIPLAEVYNTQFVFYVVPSIVTTQPDYYRVSRGSGETLLSILDNDASTGPELSVEQIAGIYGGSVSFQGDSIFFEPDSAFTGRSYINYVACDSFGTCATEVAHIFVNDTSTLSGADTLQLVTASTGRLSEFLPGADYYQVQAPQSGGLTYLNDADAFIYNPGNATGQDYLTYSNGTHTIHYEIDVLPDVHNSLVFDDYAYVVSGEKVGFNVLSNDRAGTFDIEGFTKPDHGTLRYMGNGRFDYISDSTYTGLESFTYEVCAIQNCESATVFITTSDFAPSDKVDVHQLTGLRNRDIIINYDVPVSDYEFSVLIPATNGIVEVHTGTDTISEGCVQSIGHFMISYTPDSGFEGFDQFTLTYCSAGNCTDVEVEVEIIDITNYDTCICQDQCVWPGDANHDGEVTMADLLFMGSGNGSRGIVRDFPDPNAWYGQYGDNWINPIRPGYMSNEKYCDADGDGAITISDTASLSTFYGKQHTIIPGEEVSVKPYAIGLDHDLVNPPDSGDTVRLYITIGSPAFPARNITGVAMDISFDPAVVDSSYTRITPIRESWLTRESIPLFMNRNDGINFNLGLTRTDGSGHHGYGRVFAVDIIIDDDLDGLRQDDERIPVRFYVRNIEGLDGDGRSFSIPDQQLVTYVDRSEDIQKAEEHAIHVYPNPVTDRLFLSLDRTELQSLSVYDMSGRKIEVRTSTGQSGLSIRTHELQTGMYMIVAETTSGIRTSRFLKIR